MRTGRSPTSPPTGVSANGAPVTDPNSVLLICGPDEGLLITARDSIRGWRYMEKAWVGRARNPIPLIVIHEAQENGTTQDEAQAIVSAFAAARTSENGAVGFLPAGLNLEVHGAVEADLFDKGRNASRIDIANQVNLPVSYLDGSTATSSLTYVTQEAAVTRSWTTWSTGLRRMSTRSRRSRPGGKCASTGPT